VISFHSKGMKMREPTIPPGIPTEDQIAQDIALKAAHDIAVQAEFASLDASSDLSLKDAAKRFDAIRHYAERALEALERVRPARNSVQ
jgi:hypothetical protein